MGDALLVLEMMLVPFVAVVVIGAVGIVTLFAVRDVILAGMLLVPFVAVVAAVVVIVGIVTFVVEVVVVSPFSVLESTH